MSDETYYTVLNVKETASASEIKTAYRDLIKQVHPDTIANLAPYLRRIAEDKTKEITGAYTVLSNSSKRRDYDRQLAAYRRQNVPQSPPSPATPPPAQQATSQTSSGPYCNRCGTPLYTSGFCPKCNKFTAPSATPPQPKVVRRLGYNWAPLMRWSREHPIIALAIPVFLVWFIATALSNNDTTLQADLNCEPSQRVEVNGRFVCQPLRTSTTAASVPNTPSKTGSTAKTTPDNQYVVLREEDVEEAGTAKDKQRSGSSVINLRRNSVIDLRKNSKLTVETANVPATGSNVPAETRLSSSAQPDLSGLTSSERQSIEAACSHAKYIEGPAAYDRCLVRQLGAWTVGPEEPDLSSLTSSERQSIEAACSHAKYIEGPAAYDRCLIRQFDAWATGPKEPDLSGLTSSERQSIEAACSHAKYIEGPLAYDRCLVRQLEAFTNYRR